MSLSELYWNNLSCCQQLFLFLKNFSTKILHDEKVKLIYNTVLGKTSYYNIIINCYALNYNRLYLITNKDYHNSISC